MTEGVIVKGIGGFYYIKTDNGVYECHARGKFRNNSVVPCVGDKVMISVVNEEKKLGSLDVISKRKNQLIRPPIANIDRMIIVLTPKKPMPNLLLLDKLLIIAESKGIDAVICINKTDFGGYEDIKETYEKCGYRVIAASAVNNIGVDEIKTLLEGKITVLTGGSGVGKSSLINAISGMELETGEVSKIERGKHTTRHVELFSFGNNGYIADSPGFSQLELSDIDCSDLASLFCEFNKYMGTCKFLDCSHTKEIGCAIIEAVKQGKIAKTRHENYTELYTKFKSINKWNRGGKTK